MRRLLENLGVLAAAYEGVDWAATPLGAVETWDDRLLDSVETMLGTRFPITLFWGPDLTMIYNEAYVELIGDKHPTALGRPTRDVFPEAWALIGPMLESVVENGKATWVEDALVPLDRRGFLEECYFTFSYSPLRDVTGAVAGAMDIATETTQQVISRRRLRLLSRLNAELVDVRSAADLPRGALRVLREADDDFAEVDIRVEGLIRDPTPGLASRLVGDLGAEVLVEDGAEQVASLPLRTGDGSSLLVVRLSPMLPADEAYLGFLRLVASTLRQALDHVRARTAERRASDVQRAMSEAFQRSLLPEPRGAGLPQVAARYQPAMDVAQIGGDWYDFFELPDRSLSVVIGDVAGHDQQAAAAMATVRNVLRGIAFSRHDATPGEMLAVLDTAMERTDGDLMATAVLASVSAADATRVTWTNAGHPPPVVVDAAGHARLLEAEPNLLLGLDAHASRVDHELHLGPGETLVLYTDGLVERRGVGLSEGLDWLVAVLQGTQDRTVEELADDLLDQVLGAEDDVALLVVRN